MLLHRRLGMGPVLLFYFFRFVRGSLSQCIELLYNGRVVQLDDAAGEVVQVLSPGMRPKVSRWAQRA